LNKNAAMTEHGAFDKQVLDVAKFSTLNSIMIANFV
jgi:hypothetical protein